MNSLQINASKVLKIWPIGVFPQASYYNYVAGNRDFVHVIVKYLKRKKNSQWNESFKWKESECLDILAWSAQDTGESLAVVV